MLTSIARLYRKYRTWHGNSKLLNLYLDTTAKYQVRYIGTQIQMYPLSRGPPQNLYLGIPGAGTVTAVLVAARKLLKV